MSLYDKYEMVIGLETHIELKTRSKIFCSCPTEFGAAPNTHVCPICSGMPGTLPVLNSQAVDYAIMAGLATNCTISPYSKLDRKNYFYPDLPKAYQISQYELPLASNGFLTVETPQGTKKIGITRIHIEEDAGKLLHTSEGTYIDYNRCGVPLIEVVSQPDMRSADEVRAYLRKLRSIMLYIGVSDCKMNEGSLRCDVNLSVRKKGKTELGTRCEMKNLNSFAFIAKAIDYEFRRQCELVESGEPVIQETRRFDESSGKTLSMRSKEEAQDYRYFPEPDIPPIIINSEHLRRLRLALPELPDARIATYISWGISPETAEQLTAEKDISDYFQAAASLCQDRIELAKLITGEFSRLYQSNQEDTAANVNFRISPEHIAVLCNMISDGRINRGTAKKLLGILWQEDCDPAQYAQKHDMLQITDPAVLREFCEKAVTQQHKAVSEYKNGKQAAFQSVLGCAMGLSRGKAHPVLLQSILKDMLSR